MTTNGILSILLNAAIPSILAILGGILAVRALPAEKFHHERWFWISAFIGLALVAVALTSVQQVILTTQQSEAERRSNEKENSLRLDNRYTQGQLDTMTKVLTSLASKTESGGITKDVLGALAMAARASSPAPVEPLGKPGFRGLTNRELRDRALALVSNVRSIEQQYEKETASWIEMWSANTGKFDATKAILDADAREKARWEPFRVESRMLLEEMLYRLPVDVLPKAQMERETTDMVIEQDMLAGSYPLRDVSDYLERLALLLPQPKSRR